MFRNKRDNRQTEKENQLQRNLNEIKNRVPPEVALHLRHHQLCKH